MHQFEMLIQDLRYAARVLLREPLTTLFIVVTISLGLGATLLGFGLVDRVLLRGPELVPESSRITRFFQHTDGPPFGAQVSPWVAFPIYRNLAQQLTSVTAIGAYRPGVVAAGSGEGQRSMRAVSVLGGYFDLLAVAPLRGRFFKANEDAAADGALAVISASIWHNDYSSRADIAGQVITVEGKPHTIIGVAPERFTGVDKSKVDLWTLGDGKSAAYNNWWIVARMKPGATFASVGTEADAIHARTARDGPQWTWEADISAGSLLLGRSKQLSLETVMAGWLGAISLIVLLIACANVINLLLARLTRRQRELAVRVALGAGRARVARLLWLEGALLSLLSAAGAIIVLLIAEPLVRGWIFPDEAWSIALVEPRLLLVLIAGMILTTSLFGALPALRHGEMPLAASLRTVRDGGRFQTTLRSGLTAAQAALSAILLVGAGLFVRSQMRVNAVDLGIDARQVASPSLRIAISSDSNRAVAERELYRRLVDAVRHLPGVSQVSYAVAAPLSGSGFSQPLRIPGIDSVPAYPGGGPYLTAVGPDYFATVGTDILEGRGFTPDDREGSEPVAIVGRRMANALWPDRSAVGQCMMIGAGAPCSRIVGVAADVHRNAFKEEIALQYYVPSGQEHGVSGSDLLVRAEGDPARLYPSLRVALLATDPAVRTVDPQLLSDALDVETRPLRLGLTAFGLSGGLAVLVALLGLYSLLSYMVAWRTHEIGIRMALGAARGRVVLLVVRSAILLALAGVVIGSIVAFVAAPHLEPFLFEIEGRDPVVFGAVAVSLLSVALLAGAVPAWRAVRISPTEALRAE